MPIDICHSDHLPPLDHLAGYDLAVVIDVVRAFTAAAWVLRAGAADLLLAPTPEAALAARASEWPDALLMKDGAPDPRFLLPNAPGDIARRDLTGRTVIQTTGNGTRGAHAVSRVRRVVCASFATAAGTARMARQHESILLVPTEGDEDIAFADYLRAWLIDGERPDARPYLDRVIASPAGRECVARGTDPDYPGVHPDDLARCLHLDVLPHALAVDAAGELLRVRRG